MYTKSLEYFGLVLFFVVNVMYSALLGMDLSAFISQVLQSSEITTAKWALVIAVIVIVVLVLNFTSSVLTMMTLGNLYYKFGKKGEPILLSPEYRIELNHVKGLFVSIIVLITILTLRMYFSPSEMAFNMLKWIETTIPDVVSTWGHLLVCMVAFGLAMNLTDNMDKAKNEKVEYEYDGNGKRLNAKPPKYEKLPNAFVDHFRTLIFVLMGIVLLYLVPSIGLLFESGGSLTPFKTAAEWYTDPRKQISAFYLFMFIAAVSTLAISGKLHQLYIDNHTNKDQRTYAEVAITAIVITTLMIVGMLGSAATRLTKWVRETDASAPTLILNTFILVASMVFLFVLIGLNDKKKTIFDALDPTKIRDTEYIYGKVLISLLMLFPIVSIFTLLYNSTGLRAYGDASERLHVVHDSTKRPGIDLGNTLSDGISPIKNSWDNIKTAIKNMNMVGINLDIVEIFNVIKGLLVMAAFVFSGLTINEYHQIPNVDKYKHDYKLKEIFITFIVFLILVLSVSFFDSSNFPLLLTAIIEYLAPLCVLILASYLVFYANDLAKLSKKGVITDVRNLPKENAKPPPNEIQKEIVSSKTYDGTTHRV
jgi:hypothetical protein